MKKTVMINISGIIFNIDEDAYNKLQKYLEDINAGFSNKEEGREIIADIEARIAELFTGKISAQKQVIILGDVDEIISIMGNPSDFGGEDNSGSGTGTTGEEAEKTGKSWKSKRIYRDPDHRVLGGVCGGLGAYFNLDPVIFRILMVITFFAFGPLLYIILWIAIPKARTTAQKLEMQGKEVNISNIEKNIREEFEEVKQNFKKMKDESSFRESGSIIEKLGHLFIVVFSSLAKIVVIFFGAILIIVGLVLLFAFLSTFILGINDVSIGSSSVSFHEIVGVFTDKQDISLLLITLIFVVAIPILSIIYGGIKLIFKIKTGNKYVGIIVAALWFLSLVYLLVVGAGEARQFKVTGIYQTSMEMDEPMDTLVLKKVLPKTIAVDEEHYINFEESEMKVIDGKLQMAGRPKITIERNDSNSVLLVVKKISKGVNQKEAKDNASYAEYHWYCGETVNGKKEYTFDPVYEIKRGGKWRFPRVEIILKVPVGKVLVIDKNMEDLLYDVEDTTQTPDDEMAGKTWVMKKEGLVMVSR